MKGLLIKDFKIVLSQKKLFLIAIVFGTFFAYTNRDVTFAATYIVILTAMLSLTTLTFDDINDGMSFLLSMPISRKLYVQEKYIFTALNLVFSCIISSIVCLLLGKVFGIDVNTSNIISNTVGSTVGIGLMLAVNIPIELKYGVEKSRTAIVLSVVVIAMVIFGGYKLLTNVFHVNLNKVFADVMANLPSDQRAVDAIIVGVLFLILIIILSISYSVSYRIIIKKEY